MEVEKMKNIIIAIVAILSFTLASIFDYPQDPIRPYLTVLMLLIVLNLNLQYFFELPMGIIHTLAMPDNHSARKRLLVTSWLIWAWLIYIAKTS
ncbi:hypothetical protein ACXWTF_05100 [Thiomicrolovo sp. ZZH C-3]